MVVRKEFALLAVLSMLISCTDAIKSDAYGQFEADEIIISAQVSGVITDFRIAEGDLLEEGSLVGYTDTVATALKKSELEAAKKVIESGISKADAQIAVLKEQLRTAAKEYHRLGELRKDNAIPQQSLDQAEGQVRVLERQIEATEIQKTAIRSELRVQQLRIDQIEDQVRRSRIVNPVEGRVLEVYAAQHELIQAGRPLYEIADIRSLWLRVYLSGRQLSEVSIGDEVEVRVDSRSGDLRSLKGIVSWISDKAEFTPQMIQTREERVTQMYAVKVRVENRDGSLRIGMPGEILFIPETDNDEE